MDIEFAAQTAYAAYREERLRYWPPATRQAYFFPTWEALIHTEREAWLAAMRAVLKEAIG